MWLRGLGTFLLLTVLPGIWTGSGTAPLPISGAGNAWVGVWIVLIIAVQAVTMKYVWQRPDLCVLAYFHVEDLPDAAMEPETPLPGDEEAAATVRSWQPGAPALQPAPASPGAMAAQPGRMSRNSSLPPTSPVRPRRDSLAASARTGSLSGGVAAAASPTARPSEPHIRSRSASVAGLGLQARTSSIAGSVAGGRDRTFDSDAMVPRWSDMLTRSRTLTGQAPAHTPRSTQAGPPVTPQGAIAAEDRSYSTSTAPIGTGRLAGGLDPFAGLSDEGATPPPLPALGDINLWQWRNALAFLSYLVEPVQFATLLLAGSDGVSRLLPQDSNWELATAIIVLGRGVISQLQQFSIAIAATLLYMYLCGLFIALELQPEHPMGPLLFQFMSGTLYVSITYSLLDLLLNTTSTSLHILTAEALVFYTSTSVFVSIYRGDRSAQPGVVRTMPLFLGLERVAKGALAAVTVFSADFPLARAGLMLLLFLAYTFATAVMRPSTIPFLNAFRFGSGLLGLWGSAALFVCTALGVDDATTLLAMAPGVGLLLMAGLVGATIPSLVQPSWRSFSRTSLCGDRSLRPACCTRRPTQTPAAVKPEPMRPIELTLAPPSSTADFGLAAPAPVVTLPSQETKQQTKEAWGKGSASMSPIRVT